MLKKQYLFWVLIFALFLVLALMAALVYLSPGGLLSGSVKRSLTESFGVGIWEEPTNKAVEGDKGILLDQYGPRPGSLSKPVTIFAHESAQKINGHVLSRGYDLDGFERVMLRGQFGSWKEISLVADLIGRKAFTLNSAGREWTIYLGKTVKAKCQNRMFYDKDGKAHDLTKVMVEYDQHVNEAELVRSDEMVPMFDSGDQMAVIARYSNDVMEALLLVGYDCTL